MSRWAAARRVACPCLALVWVAAHPGPASARDARVDRQVRELKALHQEILLSGALRKVDAMRAARRKRARPSDRLRSQPPRDRQEPLGPQGHNPAFASGIRRKGSIPANLRVN